MNFRPTILDGVFVVEMQPVADSRGWFARTFCKQEFDAVGHSGEWVQMNHSFTLKKGTIRGMHYQLPPHGEIKLVRCIAGAAFDVVIDLRKDSPTFLKWISVELSAENKNLIYIPEGFAHGFQALSDNTELIYHHSSYYTPGAEKGIRFNDKTVDIQWPLAVTGISDRDRSHGLLNDNFKGI
jgi:dTDP-4-dehydrorhamnose 3,5-epimerase